MLRVPLDELAVGILSGIEPESAVLAMVLFVITLESVKSASFPDFANPNILRKASKTMENRLECFTNVDREVEMVLMSEKDGLFMLF